jgi:thiamine-monophosphate kinase
MKERKHLALKRRGLRETDVLERIQEIAPRLEIRRSGVRLGIGDDAAVFKPRTGCDQILTCDWFLEGSHFLRDKHPADAVGWKCLARALSDVAAMGGVPRCFLLSLALPATHSRVWLDQFLGGLQRAAKRFACVLAGGDTTRNENILINVTVVGEARTGRAILRSGARPGDGLFVSGRLGEAELGLRLIRNSKSRPNSHDAVLKKHLYPEPRLALGRWLAEKRLPSAMMDLSDGLSTDLPRLCALSGVGARIAAGKIPTAAMPKSGRSPENDPLEMGLDGGDDYELLFTVPRRKSKHLPRLFHGLPITAIGEITKERALLLINEAGVARALPSLGWDPFREASLRTDPASSKGSAARDRPALIGS